MTEPRQRTLARFSAIAGRYARLYIPFEGTPWPESEVPTSSSFILAADGYWTSSAPIGRVHWLDPLKAAIEKLDPGAEICGFSYSAPGFNYGPVNTVFPLLGDAPRKYTPYLTDGRNPVQLGFSLGAHVITLGAAHFSSPDVVRHPLIAPRVIVQVQPPLNLASEYISSSDPAEYRGAAALAYQFRQTPRLIVRNFLGATESLVKLGTRVVFVYWPQDRFTTFPEALLADVSSAGAELICVSEIGVVANDPFLQHAQVALAPEILEVVAHQSTSPLSDSHQS